MSDFSSIENLINPTDDEESVAGRFAKKQTEIKTKEIESQTKAAAQQAGLDYVNLSGFPISPEALALIPEKTARDLNLICFYYDGEHIRFACLKPSQKIIATTDSLSKKYFADAKLYLVSPLSLKIALDAYQNLPKIKKYNSGVEITEDNLKRFQKEINNYKNLAEKINKVNITDIITLILATALKVSGSDVHIEAGETGVAIRIRIDGVLQKAAIISREKWQRIISRLKILAAVKINIDDKPQDGRFTIYLKEKEIDVRCSFLPTAYGESVVMRLLDSSAAVLDLKKLGLRPEIAPLVQREIAKPNGLILTVGPTGSGKTTSLYSILNKLNQPGSKIITLEDPIEYQLAGINQSQVEESKGYTFSAGLRSILRQDPNVVMVGEIRDLETAEIAVQASLTGHLVLSTLHTNDAAGTIPRLADMGVKPYFLAPSINMIMGQRLVRKLCPHCRVEQKLTESDRNQIKKILAVMSPKANINVPDTLPKIYQAGSGCDQCNFTGYHGRLGIYEILTMNDKIKQLTVDHAPSFKILQQAIEDGMITMLQDGVLKVLEGITSLEEVYRVIGNFDYINELYDIVISQTMGRGLKINSEEAAQAKHLSKNLSQIPEAVKNLPTRDLLNLVMSLGIVSEAGDIHIEPADTDVKIRFRIDGVMHDVLSLPKTSYLTLLSEIKILAGEATNIKKTTFDGRFTVYMPKQKVDCRLSIIAGGYGETVVIRILSSSAANLDMSELGISSINLKAVTKAIKKTSGIIVTTGPTGSGKTTTLYSILNKLNKPDVKIITIEDPIEYELPGIIQTQINEAEGYTFSSAMRSLLRQNPNIMMIGEIRDEETAKVAIEASLTGHLVLSTLHANSAAGAISRLVGLGLDHQTLANALEFTIGQRLVRRVCPYCKHPVDIDPKQSKRVKEILSSIKNPEIKIPEKLQFYEGSGCEHCGQIGYHGRIGLYETITINPNIRSLMQKPEITDFDIETAAIADGTITMIQDGILKALDGQTSLEEVFRVI